MISVRNGNKYIIEKQRPNCSGKGGLYKNSANLRNHNRTDYPQG